MSATTIEAPRTNEFAIGDLVAVFKSIDQTLKELAAYANGAKRVAATESQALALLIEMGPNIADIAERLGVHRSTLYRWPKFMEQVGRVRRAGMGG
jgi:DNA-binding MarR family transcriptional regulator